MEEWEKRRLPLRGGLGGTMPETALGFGVEIIFVQRKSISFGDKTGRLKTFSDGL
ncbi:MAG: hypothetical protein Q4G28_08965 [Neisseria sp.]|nr:hypothetical protein [Neisseria sp.]